MPARHFFFIPPAFVAPLAQAGPQSALAAAGEDAARLLDLSRVLFIGGGLIFAAVMLVLTLALFGPPRARAALGRHALIIGGGIVFPAVTLFALLVYSLVSNPRVAQADAPAAMRVEVIGELWWWRVRYLDESGALLMETANEIRIPIRQPVDVLLKSDNVIHSFWVPALAGKIDLIPGHLTRQRLEAREAGVYRGQCAEYCGAQHAKMALYVVALEPEAFDAWLSRQVRPAAEPGESLSRRGKQLFMANRCGLCHAIRGTPADGGFGPDLTHVGSRLSIGGGILPQNQGTIAGWISQVQALKPGAKMPAYSAFTGLELRALSAYLAQLD